MTCPLSSRGEIRTFDFSRGRNSRQCCSLSASNQLRLEDIQASMQRSLTMPAVCEGSFLQYIRPRFTVCSNGSFRRYSRSVFMQSHLSLRLVGLDHSSNIRG